MNNYGVSSELLDEYAAAERALDDVKRRVSHAALANIGMKKGDLVVDEDSGLHYRLEWCSVWINRNEVEVSVQGRRVWKSGRKAGREAYTASFLRFKSLKKVDDNA